MISLPKDDTALAEVLTTIAGNGVVRRAPLRVDWFINYWYLQGCRQFHIHSWKTGAVEARWESALGQYRLRFEDLVEQYNRELGLLLQLNVRPTAKPRKLMELDGHRQAALARVYLEHVLSALPVEALHRELMEGVLLFGTMGLGTWVNTELGLDHQAVIETIPPWQLTPIPSPHTMCADVNGVMRHRWVPYDDLKDRFGKSLKWPKADNPRKDPDGLLDVRWAKFGERIPEDEDVEHSTTTPLPGSTEGYRLSDPGGSAVHDREVPYVRLTETWLHDERKRVHTAVVMLGKYIARRTTWERPETRPPFPIGIARGHAAGGFYARPWLSLLVGLNSENEATISNLFRNAQEYDILPAMLLPANRGIKKEFLAAGVRPRVEFVEPDMTGEKYQIERIEPANSNEMPGRTAQFGLQLMDRLSRNSKLYQGEVPGRMESALGVGMLLETGNISRNPLQQSVEDAWTTVYRCMLWWGHSHAPAGFRLSTIDDAVAGVALGPDGNIKLDTEGAIPLPDEVQLGIREKDPKILTQRKQEIVQMIQLQVLSPEEAVWINYVEGLGLPLGREELIRQTEVAMWRNIIQFNDGVTPRGVTYNNLDDHATNIRVMTRFMRSIVYNLASAEVQSAFEERLKGHQALLGGAYPEEWPPPEEAAASNAMPGLPPQLEKEITRMQERLGGLPPPPGGPPQVLPAGPAQ